MFWGREFVREVSEIIKPITGLFMLAVMVFMLLARATDISIFSLISYCAAGGAFLCSWRFVGLREVYLSYALFWSDFCGLVRPEHALVCI